MKKDKKPLLSRVNVPLGKSGDWEVSRFGVDESDVALYNLRARLKPGCRTISPGIYTKLTRSGKIIMSDTPAELNDHWEPARRARDDRGDPDYPNNILINSLGLGVVAQAILDEPTVRRLTVVEKSSDVIALVGLHYAKKYGNRLEIVCADALDWRPPKGQLYRVVWHDIWDDICGDNLLEMHKLHRKYGRRCDWQGSWCRWICEQLRGGSFTRRCG